jgi:hypothetical protein
MRTVTVATSAAIRHLSAHLDSYTMLMHRSSTLHVIAWHVAGYTTLSVRLHPEPLM